MLEDDDVKYYQRIHVTDIYEEYWFDSIIFMLKYITNLNENTRRTSIDNWLSTGTCILHDVNLQL